MATFTPEELERDILEDLIEEINELYEASEQTLMELEITPEDNELQRALFRSVHTIKGDLGLVGFTPMILMLQHMEDLLDMLRKGQINYTSNMSDLVLIAMDRVKTFVNDCMLKGKAEYHQEANDKVVETIKLITPENASKHDELLNTATSFLDPSKKNESTAKNSEKTAKPIPKAGIPKNLTPEQMVDVLFFRELMKPIEKRIGYKEGRADRIAKLAFFINGLAGNPIDEAQLAVACYVHDFGMSFLPLEVIRSSTPLSELQKNLLRSHVYKSARLLENLSQWDVARKIVMEHHEYGDGTGYPLGLNSEKICDGAKLLSILDKYDGLTNQGDTSNMPSISKKEAVIKLNREYKGKLSGKWLRLFNQAITSILQAQ
ncbi:HD-GYP domain-containing protein [Glaciecola sp. KUL10]|uniref:HD-GYP domain-containing protein n=1 Tax=Glaciecola sp. (strain KUL10) TaxID=2161813 RepID=UPI000D78486B|nr:HD domain-containing phosphohydrolase [Glaciecola sp. KUL10]GBL04918.1 HD-GYP domain-containing protein [Glaciecola sp. KUL10]